MNLLQKEIQNGNLHIVKQLVDEGRVLSDAKWTDYNLLRSALRCSKKEISKYLISKGFRVNRIPCTFFEHTPLHLAVNLGCLEIVEMLLNCDAFITSKNKNQETPLILAAKLNKFAIVDLMLSNITQENCTNTENLSHMHIACMRNRVDIAKIYLQSGVSINHAVSMTCIRWAGYTPLHFAVEFHCLETVDFLLSCGASIIVRDGKEQTPLHIAFMHQNNLIIDLILSAHAYQSENPTNLENLSHFHIACTRNNCMVVESFLLEKKSNFIDETVSINATNWSGYSALHFAIEFECIDVVKLLLAYNAALGAMENYERCPINLAYRSGNVEIINLLQRKYDKRPSITSCKKSFSPFHLACIKGADLLKIRLYSPSKSVNQQVDSNFPRWPGWTPLHLAVKHNRDSIVTELIQQEANIAIKDPKGRTPLHLAFELNNLCMIDRILTAHSAFANENPSNNQGLSHFHIACTRENIDIIKYFIQSGVDVNAAVSLNAVFYPGFTPLHFAVKYKLSTVVQLLLTHNADVTVKNGLGLTALDQAITNYDRYESNDRIDYTIIELLLLARERLHLDPAYDRGLSLLHVACAKNDVAGIKRYLSDRTVNQTVDLTSPKWAGYTPLHFATYGNHDAAIVLLLENENCDISAKDADGSTPLHLRYVYNKFDFTSNVNKNILVCEGNPVGSDGMSHFHFACVENDLAAVQYFLQHDGVDVNLATNFEIENHWHAGTTGLHIAVSHSNARSLVQLLLEHGADVNARDAYMQTPLHRCGRNWDTAIIRMLVERGADVNALDKYKRTPLFIASNLQYVDQKIAAVLLENGADMNIESFGGKVPLSINACAFEDNPNYIAVLMKHLKKLLIIGHYVSKKNRRIYAQEVSGMVEDGFINERIFTKQCLRELRAMRKIYVDNYTTVRDIVFKGSNKMSRHAKNDTLIKIANSKEFKKKFPIYGYLLKLQLKKGQERRPLLEAAQQSLRFLSQRKLCSVSIDKILDYLRGDDLKSLVHSTRMEIAS